MSEQHRYEIKADPDNDESCGEAEQTRQDLKGKSKRLLNDLDEVVDEVNKVVREAVGRGSDAVGALGENVKQTWQDTVRGQRSARTSVVMVRVDSDSLQRLDELIEAGLCSSRSEAAHYLITEGVKAKQDTFDKISLKIEEIRKAKRELRELLGEDLEDTSD
jgi:hypothetical protein